MKYRRFVAAVVLTCGMGAGELFAQAAAESVLTHGLSSTAGSSLGKTLGNAMGNAASQLGGRLGQQTSVPAVQRIPATRPKTASVPAGTPTAATASSSGSMIASIQGGATSSTTANCAVTPKAVQSDLSQGKSAHAGPVAGTPEPTAPPVAASASVCQAAQGTDSHPSVVNLPAAN